MVGDLSVAEQQMVEIAKALAFEAAIVIMDEPTSALLTRGRAAVPRHRRPAQSRGDGHLHQPQDERSLRLADRVIVIRDGQFVASAARRKISPDQVVRWMVGREIAALNYEPHPIAEQAVLEVESLSLASPPGERPAQLAESHVFGPGRRGPGARGAAGC